MISFEKIQKTSLKVTSVRRTGKTHLFGLTIIFSLQIQWKLSKDDRGNSDTWKLGRPTYNSPSQKGRGCCRRRWWIHVPFRQKKHLMFPFYFPPPLQKKLDCPPTRFEPTVSYSPRDHTIKRPIARLFPRLLSNSTDPVTVHKANL